MWKAPPLFSRGGAFGSVLTDRLSEGCCSQTFGVLQSGRLTVSEASKALVELGDLAPGVDHALHAGPGRVGFRVDVETQYVASLTHAGAGRIFRSVCHDDSDLVVVGVDTGFHDRFSFVAETPMPTGVDGADYQTPY